MGSEKCPVNAEFNLALRSEGAPRSSASTVFLGAGAHTSEMGLAGLSAPSGAWPLSLREGRR